MPFIVNEVRAPIRVLNPKNAPGYDLITNQVLQKLSEKGIRFIIQLSNAVLRQNFFPPQWKIAKTIMIQKPGKPTELAESYRPISLVPVLSKLFDKLLLSRLLEMIERPKIIPNHQFEFRYRCAIIEQIHRLVKKINIDMDAGRYCTAAFLDDQKNLTRYGMQAYFTKSKFASYSIYMQL